MTGREAGARINFGVLWAHIGRVHDAVNRAGFVTAAGLLGAVVLIYSHEVVVRYFFAAPTKWASDVVTYFQCAMIFLVMPDLTRRSEHVAITFLPEALSPPTARVLRKLALLTGAVCCVLAACLSAQANISQFRDNVTTVAAISIPKWWVSSFITYGFAGSALYFLRMLWAPEDLAVFPDGEPRGLD